MSQRVEPTIIARCQGRIGRITINRPQALNAVDHGMIRAIREALDGWRDDAAVHAVVIEGAGDRAFCAGGDIQQVRDLALAGRYADIKAFFTDEYALNLAIARYPKPYISLIDGACMGGGIGLSVHGSARVVTEAAVLAMPETAIGFFPDVGASFLLPRLRPGYGMFLALTGSRVHGADAAYLGLATHYVARERIATLADEIAEAGPAALATAARPLAGHEIAAHAEILPSFRAESVAAIMQNLETLDSEPASKVLSSLHAMSPTALLRTFELIRFGKTHTLKQCLALELRLTRQAVRHPDFAEGVRAMVIDKDRKPNWSPKRLEDIDPASIAAFFKQG